MKTLEEALHNFGFVPGEKGKFTRPDGKVIDTKKTKDGWELNGIKATLDPEKLRDVIAEIVK